MKLKYASCALLILCIMGLLAACGSSSSDDSGPSDGLGLGALCRSNPQGCESGTFCNFVDMGCNIGASSGVCSAIPSDCPETPNAVCGCDNTTYLNECRANAQSVSVAANQACGAEEDMDDDAPANGDEMPEDDQAA